MIQVQRIWKHLQLHTNKSSIQLIVIFCFISFFLACIPLWWFTSRVYRVDLPHIPNFFNENAEELFCPLEITLVWIPDNNLKYSFDSLKMNTLFQSNLDKISEKLMDLDLDHSKSKGPSFKFSFNHILCSSSSESDPNIIHSLCSINNYNTTNSLKFIDNNINVILSNSKSKKKYYFIIFLNLITDTDMNLNLPTWTLGQYRHGWINLPVNKNIYITFDKKEYSLLDIFSCYLMPSLYNLLVNTLNKDLNNSFQSVMLTPLPRSIIISFSLLNSKPEELWDWSFQEARDLWLNHLVYCLDQITHIDIDSQLLFYGNISNRKPRFDNKTSEYYYTPDDLSQIFGLTYWNRPSQMHESLIGSSVNALETVVFIPPIDFRPLSIRKSSKDRSSYSFTIPHWGCVIIYNPNPNMNQDPNMNQEFIKIDLSTLRNIISHFIGQFRMVFGLGLNSQPDFDFSFSQRNNTDFCNTLSGFLKKHPILPTLLPAGQSGFTLSEIDSISLKITYSRLISSISTLNSLSDLLDKIPDIPVLDIIASMFTSSLKHFDYSVNFLKDGCLEKSIREASLSLDIAENAFYHPSMVGLAYFPDQHVFAVYASFFIPVILPIFLHVIQLIKGEKKKSMNEKQKLNFLEIFFSKCRKIYKKD